MAPLSTLTKRYTLLRNLLISSRRRLGLSQAEVARRLCKSQSFVSKYERGERRLDVVEFLDVAEILQLDAAATLRKLGGN